MINYSFLTDLITLSPLANPIRLSADTPVAPNIHPDVMEVLDDLGQWFGSISLGDWAWVGVVVHFALTIYIFIRILSNQRNTGVAIAWLVLLFAIPFIGIIAYLLVGEPYLGKRYKERSVEAHQLLKEVTKSSQYEFDKIDAELPKRYKGVSRIGQVDTGFGVYHHQQMRLLTSPDSIFDALIADIHSAKAMILMEFYIVFPKGRVHEVFEALIQACERGVECQILADSVGSFSFFVDDWHERLSDAGVIVHQSLPVGLFKTLFKRTDLRNHRKIVVIDERIGYTGSFNLVDPAFFKQDKDVGQWIDVAMRITSDAPISIVRAMAMVTLTDISAESRDNLDALSHFIEHQIHNYTRKLYYAKPTINDINDKASTYTHGNYLSSPLSHTSSGSLTNSLPKSLSTTLSNTLSNTLSKNVSESTMKDSYGQELSVSQTDNVSDPDTYHQNTSYQNTSHQNISHKDENNKNNKHKNYTDKNSTNHSAMNSATANVENSIQGDHLIEKKLIEKQDLDEISITQQNINSMPMVKEVMAQLIPSAPRLTEHVIYNTLLTVLNRANNRIMITTPYFVPNDALLSALTTAAKRGVDVTLIVPYKVDSFLVQHASQASYSILLEAGVNIALFKGGLLHAKTVVIDDDYCLFGTVNMDMRSFYLNMEVSLAIYTPEVVAQVLACQQAYLAQSEMQTLETWIERPKHHKLFDAGIRLFSPLL